MEPAMCGVLGIFGLNAPVHVDDRAVQRMRDTMTHRGPDDAGLWRCPWAVLAHRRLSVIDPGPAGHQPMLTPDGRCALVYNGELYNDAELRDALSKEGVVFRTRCDTEAVLMALACWGPKAIDRFRGMFALGFVDTREQTVVLARDPLGIKPLYTARADTSEGPQIVFASEPPAVLAHPDVPVRPDWVGVSAYLTTIRPTLGATTLFEGLDSLLPGETRIYDARRRGPPRVLSARPVQAGVSSASDAGAVIGDAVRAHLRTDVPMCALLSGGLDSGVVVSLAAESSADPLHTYCAGAREPGADDDFAHAALLASRLRTRHREVPVDAARFGQRWSEIVERTGVPVSTPNEIAIYEVAAALRAEGHVVTLSGEGADELFGGYAPPMLQAAEHVASLAGRPDDEGGLFHLRSNAWIDAAAKRAVLLPERLDEAGRDAAMEEVYRATFRELASDAPTDSPLQPHLRFHRRMNLPNLLRRLDSATMLASVEGRTPFADVRVAAYAEALPMRDKFRQTDPPLTKVALREAFRGVLPSEIAHRPKASFPLPFQSWMGPAAAALPRSAFARSVFTPEVIETVAADPRRVWMLAWPVLNISAWGERWWGGSGGTAPQTWAAAAAV
jgi:asparagine synthase (glutamine-hydrolysing)